MRFTPQTYRITIEKPTTSKDSSGGVVQAWGVHSQPYASIIYDKASEGIEGLRNRATTFAKFKVRYDSDTKSVDNTYRILFDGATWDIERVFNLGRDEGIELYANKKE